MAATRNKARADGATATPPVPLNGTGAEVLTLAEAATYLRLAPDDVVRLVHDQGLPGRQFGKEWRFLKLALQDWLRIPSSSPGSQPDLMQWAGAFRDDPDLQEIVREAYRRRGRPMTEEAE